MASVSHQGHKDELATKHTKITKGAAAGGGLSNGLSLRSLRVLRVLCGLIVFVLLVASVEAQDTPALTAPVNDFANVIDPATERALESRIRSLQRPQATSSSSRRSTRSSRSRTSASTR